MRGLLLLLIVLVSAPAGSLPAASGQPLAGFSAPVILPTGASGGAAAWADYDLDGDLDLLVTGMGYTGSRETILLRNDGGSLAAVSSGLPRVEGSSADWGDYNNDGYLDLLLTGTAGFSNGSITGLAAVYRNIPSPTDPGRRSFNLGAALPGVHQGDGKWGDYDNDGRLDVLLTGTANGGAPLTRLFHNNGDGGFIESPTPLEPLGSGSPAWGDYDNDDFLDFVISGRDAGGALRALVYRNDGGLGFFPPVELPGAWGGEVSWIDVENDGDLDLLLTGNRGENSGSIQPLTQLYRFEAGVFSLMSGSGLPNLWQTSIAVGDYNNDGFADLLANGLTASSRPTAVYINNRDFTFSLSGTALPQGTGIAAAWADFDRDGALDALLSGVTLGARYTTQLYLNNNPRPPVFPPPPAPLLSAACWDGANTMVLEWSPGKDSGGVTFNVRAASTTNGIDIQNPQSNLASGARQLPRPGNAYANNSAVFHGPFPTRLKLAVQAVSASLAGGPFGGELVAYPGSPVAAPDSFTTFEDTPISLRLLDNDNTSYGSLSVYKMTSPVNGTLNETAPGVYSFTPNADWNGTALFNYSALSSSLYCSLASVKITVKPVNDAPRQVRLSSDTILENLPAGATVGQLQTDDPDAGDSHSYALVPDEKDALDNALFQISGSTLQTAAVLSYAAAAQYTINVRTTDTGGLSHENRLTIKVMPNTPVSIQCVTNCAGYTSAPNTVRVAMSEDGSPVPFELVLRGTGYSAGELLAWSLAAAPARGSVSFPAGTLPGADQPIQYTPAADDFGPDSFAIQLRGAQGHTDTLNVNVEIAPVNDPPTLDAIGDQVFAEGSGEHTLALTGIGPGPANEAGQPLTITAQTDCPWLLRDLAVEWDGASESAALRFTIGAGSGAGDMVGSAEDAEAFAAAGAISVNVDDGQGANSVTTRTFIVTIEQRQPIYLPALMR